MAQQWGASQEAWAHFDVVLGLTNDLLPVVSNPNAIISPMSKMQGIGKTPSKYNGSHEVVGLVAWTAYQTTPKQIEKWSKEPDYGIALQTRTVRAFDIDVDDDTTASQIEAAIVQELGVALPTRTRSNSGKRLLVFELEGRLAKRVIRTSTGIVEFLASGQQFIAVGTHTSGARYEWRGGLPVSIPVLSTPKLEAVWSMLERDFGTGEGAQSKVSTRSEVLNSVHTNDPVAALLFKQGAVLGQERDGRLHITCPFEGEHTSDTGVASTSYFPANTGGYANGHFKCLHAHCENRTDDEFKQALGLPSTVDDFDLGEPEGTSLTVEQQALDDAKPPRYEFKQAGVFSSGKPPDWLVKDVLPEAGLAVVFGDSTSGKTFWVLDLVFAIARGIQWRDKDVKQGAVAFVVAEGAGGFRGRLRAYGTRNDVGLVDIPLHVLNAAPNFLVKDDVRDVARAVDALGKISVIVVDTLAQVMPGANENSGEDVGKALAHCRALHERTGALVILVHHSGKDATRGARGWSGLRAAADCEIEISRNNDDREATVTKLKDGVDGQSYGFKLESVPYEMTDDGDTLTSAVIAHGEGHVKRERGMKVGRVERLIVSALESDADLTGAGSKVETIVDAVVQQIPFDEGSNKRDPRRSNILRALTTMADKGLLSIAGGFIQATTGGTEDE